MTRRFINEYSDGDVVDEVYLLAEKQMRANRNASLYLLTNLRDKTGVMSGLMWNVQEGTLQDVNAGDYVQAKGKVQLYQGALQMILTKLEKVPAEKCDPEEFQPSVGADVEQLESRLREILLGIDDPALRTLMECFLTDEELMSLFRQAPAGVKTHHAYHGGLIEHVVNILETAVRIADLYPTVNIDLLLAGIFLHDFGKIRELTFENSLLYSDEGQLLGHMAIGLELITKKIAEVEKLTSDRFPEETALRLKHMVISHHGTLEFGSARLPMTPEAIALHHLDNLDAKVHEFSKTIEEDPIADSRWTPFNPRLDRKLFKGFQNET